MTKRLPSSDKIARNRLFSVRCITLWTSSGYCLNIVWIRWSSAVYLRFFCCHSPYECARITVLDKIYPWWVLLIQLTGDFFIYTCYLVQAYARILTLYSFNWHLTSYRLSRIVYESNYLRPDRMPPVRLSFLSPPYNFVLISQYKFESA